METLPLHVPILEAMIASRRLDIVEKDGDAGGGCDPMNVPILDKMPLRLEHSPT